MADVTSPTPTPTIGNWDTTQLVRFIRDILENQPPSYLPTALADELTVTKKLSVSDLIEFTKAPNFTSVGTTGAPAFQHNWSSWGSPYSPAGYWKDPLGFVHLRGVIKATVAGDVGQVAFTLPPGYRPPATVIVPVLSNAAIGRLDIRANGDVTPFNPSSFQYVTLDNIHFRTT